MQRPDFKSFFRDYAALYNKALGDAPDYQGIANCFTECFVAAGPQGAACGHNDKDMLQQLEKNYAFYKQIGAKQMQVLRTLETQIDGAHHLVKVFYRASYDRNGQDIVIDFDVTYLLQTQAGQSRIFAFIAGDEMGAYKRAGLID